ncbi:DUF4397 domain-containing protein [Mucilaginibacter sp.]|uniref:DUF4397 domain-containing protein n=1 Tax=Mucilaginibacter sp. TaxID=1882438 RepID=UPI003AFF7644
MNQLKTLFAGLIISYFSLIVLSCNTSGVSPAHHSRLQVINALAGSTPINFSLNSTQKNTSVITFPGSSGYISVSPGSNYIRFITSASTTNLSTRDTAQQHLNLTADSSYSVFLTGSTSNYSLLKVNDILTNPANTRAKIRFVNVAPDAGALDITINGTGIYSKIAYKSVAPFVEVPAGTYEFKAMKTGITGTTLATLSNQVLADGKVYTLYAAGLTTSTAVNAAFSLTVMANLLPAIK